MTEPEWRQCGAVDIGRVPLDGHLFRCGLEAGHHEGENPTRHSNWQDLGRVQDPDGTGWAGRVLDSLWEQVTKEDPDAWRAPDDATRGETPPAGQVPEASAGWAVTGRGKAPRIEYLDFMIEDPPPGRGSMASIAEVQAAMAAANGLIEEAQQALHAAQEKAQAAAATANAVLEGSGHEAAHAGLAYLTDAEVKITETIQVYEAAKDQFGTYTPGL